MELREYIRIIFKNWWLILAITLISITLTLLLTYSQTPVFQATSTYVTRLTLDEENADNAIFGLDTLLTQQRIFVTYCDVLSSQAVRVRAIELMGANPASLPPSQYEVVCNVLPESNVLQLNVNGPSIPVIERMNQAIGLAGMERINALYSIFPIEPLDPVEVEPEPISPNYPFNAVLSVALGLTISITLALLLEQLRNPLEEIQARSIYDVEFNLYNTRYFRDRMGQEIERARIHARPLTLALVRLVPNEDFDMLPEHAQLSLLRVGANILEDNLRRGDIIAHYKDSMFEILLPETSGDTAIELITELHNLIRRNYIESGIYKTNFSVNSGLVESSGGMLDVPQMMEEANKALQKADNKGKNIIELTRTTPRPFVFEHEAFDLDNIDPNATQPIVFQTEGNAEQATSTRRRRSDRSRDTGASLSRTRPPFDGYETQGESGPHFDNADYAFSFDQDDFDAGEKNPSGETEPGDTDKTT